ncbi:DUF348 domain-containing protein [Crassaminicella thermophila]|uniref:DUF348 domain-containing protein n=1 Tax=Crassaminicella thermophila TaxID=2599308 RepID=A0A5C0SIV8_CRATE|nr:3D domain-containing protein [Crassaminicella thermophila]QEK13374.1 DUF348 domain-containing protein [Crassaminicella thermophila]
METESRNVKFFTKRNLMILGIVLLIGIFSVSYGMKKEVIIKDGEKKVKVCVRLGDVADAIKKGNITLNEHDKVSIPLKSKVKDGMVIAIERAHPVNIQLEGKLEEVLTANEKVKDILDEYSIIVDDDDKVMPGLDEKVEKYETITVVKVDEEIVSKKEIIPFESVIQYSDKLDKGKVNLIQQGKNGEREAKYKVVYEDGKEVSKELIEEKVIVSPQKEIVEKGTALYVATSRGNIRVKKAIKMTATAYDATFASTGKHPGDPYYGITRSGTKVRPGVVAVDPRVIPLGTKLYIEALDGSKDYGFASAEDTGGAIKGNRIDLYFESPNDVAKYGKRKVMVYILE